MNRTPMGFSRVSTGDSDMPSSCEMKDKPEFKPLQGNWAFFSVRACRGIFHLRQKTQGRSHIPTAEGKLVELFLESWLTSSLKDRDSALILGPYGMHGAFLDLLS